MADTKAWLLQFSPQHRAAVGQRELLHLEQSMSRYPVPLAPAHCAEAIYWQGQPIPLMDVAMWLASLGPSNDASHIASENRKYISLVGYQAQPGAAPHFGAFWLMQPPSLVDVNDDQACSLAKAGMEWPALATICFTHEDETGNEAPIPVLDLGRIFAPKL